MNELSVIFQHAPHARTRERLRGEALPPPRVDDQRVGLNGRIGLFVTTIVGTMWAAYLFALLAFVSLPAAIRSGDSLVIVSWIAQTFLQLVLLPVIIVGQNLQSRAADRRAQETYKDAEAVLHECMQIQAHLTAQDQAQSAQLASLRELVLELRDRLPQSPSGT